MDSGLKGKIYIGCAGWSLRAEAKGEFSKVGSQLERYARRFNCVEINSCFYRDHRQTTWKNWADSVPENFRFSYKLPKRITHEYRLAGVDILLEEFAQQISMLKEKKGPLLVQLPPSLEFEKTLAEKFLAQVAGRFDQIAIEPRHRSWFTVEVDGLLNSHGVAGVAADPPRDGQLFEPFGSSHLRYMRLHGSPKIYYSEYDEAFIERTAARIRNWSQSGSEVWCVFDNTAEGYATFNALSLSKNIYGTP